MEFYHRYPGIRIRRILPGEYGSFHKQIKQTIDKLDAGNLSTMLLLIGFLK